MIMACSCAQVISAFGQEQPLAPGVFREQPEGHCGVYFKDGS